MNPYIYAGLPATTQAFATCNMIEGYRHADKRKRHLAAQHVVSTIYGVHVDHLKDPPDRRMMFVEARSMLFFYLRITGYTCVEVARAYSRDHSSVVHGTKKFLNAVTQKRAPERAGFIRLLYECGHIPALIVNTVAGTEYLDEIFDKKDFNEFFNLNLARYDELLIAHEKRKLVAKLKQEELKSSVSSTYFSRIKDAKLDSIYHRKAVTSRR